jgi:hypothetical protein
MSDPKEPAVPANLLSGKTSSKFAQIIAALWIAGWSAYTFISGKDIDITDIMLSGVGITAMFLPIYSSILLDKIKNIKFGKDV